VSTGKPTGTAKRVANGKPAGIGVGGNAKGAKPAGIAKVSHGKAGNTKAGTGKADNTKAGKAARETRV
jgi:hypothetical protein